MKLIGSVSFIIDIDLVSQQIPKLKQKVILIWNFKPL